MAQKRKRLGDLLVESGYIKQEQLEEALRIQKTVDKKLAQILIENDMITEDLMLSALSSQLGIPFIKLSQQYISPAIPQLITEQLARLHCAVPIKLEDTLLTVAVNDPLNLFAIDDIEIATGHEVFPVLAKRQEIIGAIERYYGKQVAERAIEDFRKQQNVTTVQTEAFESDEVAGAPVVRLVESILKQAVVLKASDIHIEPFNNALRIRFRIDGVLQEIMKPSKSTHSAIITRLKILADMEISEKRIPQDGRFETAVEGRMFDMRVSMIPTVYGEKCVIRLLARDGIIVSKEQLGFTKNNLKAFDNIIQNPNGILLITGPTGSGKTTTLYTVLKELNKTETNIITVEDPVEYRLDGVNQVQVNTKAGLTFANGLRSILRQDPDIIMIGEMRDTETAEIAVRSAITGHFVLSTIHTNDTASTISRLIDMGIEPYFVSSAVVGIIAQRLMRKLCTNCRKAYTPDEVEAKLIGMEKPVQIYKAVGCPVCNKTGYKGRTAIHEILTMSREIRLAVAHGLSIEEIQDIAVSQGMVLLSDNARQLVLDGVTSTEEMLRVAYAGD